MQQLRYIHAADLHLDAPFSVFSDDADASLSRQMRKASFTSLERLERLCENERPDFLVLSGDLYNAEHHSIRAQLALRDLCERLSSLNIRVFMAHGQHDPLESRLTSIHWPANTHIFDKQVQTVPLERDGEQIAIIHGASHSQGHTAGNLAGKFKRVPDASCFQLGVLHCAVDNHACGHPVSGTLQDLRQSGLDAFALGGAHGHCTLSEQPFIAYAGTTQGLDFADSGMCGCHVVTVRHDGKTFACEASFRPLGPVVFDTVAVKLDGISEMADAEQLLDARLEKLEARHWPQCDTLLVRVVLEGATALDDILRKETRIRELRERFSCRNNGGPSLRIHDIVVRTVADATRNEEHQRDDFLGCFLRKIQLLRENPAQMQSLGKHALHAVYGHNQLRDLLQAPGEATYEQWLNAIASRGVSMLEAGDVR